MILDRKETEKAAVILGILSVIVGLLGLIGLIFRIRLISSVIPGYQTMAFGTSLILICFGAILAFMVLRPFGDQIASLGRIVVGVILTAIILAGIFELPLSAIGKRGAIMMILVGAGDSLAGEPTAAISPATQVLAIVAGIALLLLVFARDDRSSRQRHAAGLIGLAIAVGSLTFILSYVYQNPLMYGTGLVPIALSTAIGFFFLGSGITAAAGPSALPLSALAGTGTQARLLRAFLPLTFLIVIATGILTHEIVSFFPGDDAIITSAGLVLFSLITGWVIIQTARHLGNALETEEHRRFLAEEDLTRKNAELESSNEELQAAREDLRKVNTDLEERVWERTADLARKNEELAQLNEELGELNDDLQKSTDDLRERELEITRLAQQRQIALDAAKLGSWRYDPVNHSTTYDDRYREIFGFTSEEKPTLNNLQDRIHPSDLTDFWKKINEALDPALLKPYDSIYRIILPDGNTRWISSHGIALFERDGDKRKAVGLVGAAEDITARKQAEESINRSLREKEVLLKEIHHRVKNNLQIVISLFSLQSRSIKDEKILNIFRESQNRVKAMALVHEKLYRSEDVAHIDLTDYLRFLVSSLFTFYNISSQNVRFTIDMKDVRVDIQAAIPIGLIINELVSNSLKHAFPPGVKGEVSVTGHKESGRILITVKDTGKGFPENFDWQHTETMGLRLVLLLTEQMHGSIDLEEGPGTTFKMVLQERIGTV